MEIGASVADFSACECDDAVKSCGEGGEGGAGEFGGVDGEIDVVEDGEAVGCGESEDVSVVGGESVSDGEAWDLCGGGDEAVDVFDERLHDVVEGDVSGFFAESGSGDLFFASTRPTRELAAVTISSVVLPVFSM